MTMRSALTTVTRQAPPYPITPAASVTAPHCDGPNTAPYRNITAPLTLQGACDSSLLSLLGASHSPGCPTPTARPRRCGCSLAQPRRSTGAPRVSFSGRQSPVLQELSLRCRDVEVSRCPGVCFEVQFKVPMDKNHKTSLFLKCPIVTGERNMKRTGQGINRK